jgi:NADPH-dependent ferric siderophore reductase
MKTQFYTFVQTPAVCGPVYVTIDCEDGDVREKLTNAVAEEMNLQASEVNVTGWWAEEDIEREMAELE